MRFGLILNAAVALVAVPWAVCGPVTPFAEKNGFKQLALLPFAGETYSLRCKAKESTRVIVYGQGSSSLAVYVYDIHGNCVAHDDVTIGSVSDDLALEWYSPTQANYDVDVRNLGRKSNTAEIAIR